MNRTAAEWLNAAHNATDNVTQLGNELRDRWDDWKDDLPYASWKNCIKAELGITAQALHDRNYKARKKAKVGLAQGDTDLELEEPQPMRIQQRQTTSEERERRRAIVGRLWDEGYAYKSIAAALDIGAGSLATDLKSLGLTERRNPLGVMSIPIPDNLDVRWKEEEVPKAEPRAKHEPTPPFVSKTLRVPAGACAIASADQRIVGIKQALDDLLGGDIYALSLKDRNRLLTILQEAIERLTNDQDAPQAVRRTG